MVNRDDYVSLIELDKQYIIESSNMCINLPKDARYRRKHRLTQEEYAIFVEGKFLLLIPFEWYCMSIFVS